MSAPMSKKILKPKTVKSESSSDEDENEHLKDCIDTEMFKSCAIVATNNGPKNANRTKKKSIRDVLYGDNIEDENHLLESTPGFRDHVSNKLSQFLEREIEEFSSHYPSHHQISEESNPSGFKLLSVSKPDTINVDDIDESHKVITKKKRKVQSSDDSDSDTEKFACVAVSSNFIIENSAMPMDVKEKQLFISKNCNLKKVACKGTNEDNVKDVGPKKKKKHKKKDSD